MLAQASATAALGGVAVVKFDIVGLDEAIKAAKAALGPNDADSAKALDVLRLVSERHKESDGTVVDHYTFSLAPRRRHEDQRQADRLAVPVDAGVRGAGGGSAHAMMVRLSIAGVPSSDSRGRLHMPELTIRRSGPPALALAIAVLAFAGHGIAAPPDAAQLKREIAAAIAEISGSKDAASVYGQARTFTPVGKHSASASPALP